MTHNMNSQIKVSANNMKLEEETHIKHGEFYVYHENGNGVVKKVLISPLSQEEIADGWTLVLPKVTKKSTIHHFNIYLSQLPPHLWRYITGEEKQEITDKIYKYSIKKSKHDKNVLLLYNLLHSRYLNIQKIEKIFKHLQNSSIKGWVMNKAYNVIQSYNNPYN